MRIDRSLLLVVDVQNCFINDATKHVIEPINQLIRHWHVHNGLIIFSRFINPKGGPWERFRNWQGARTEPEILLHPDLISQGGQIIDKHSYSAWGNELAKRCQERHIETVVLCGVDTNECVLATAIAIFDSGSRPLVAADACASRGVQFHTAAIKLLEVLIGKEQVIRNSQLLLLEN